MFRRRSELLKRVWKFWRGAQRSESRLESNEGEDQTATEVQAVLYSLLKRLSDNNLKLLVDSLESCGKRDVGCVLLPTEEIRLGRRTVQPHHFLCKVFRWADLASTDTVKPLWICKTSHEDAKLSCCNPYHYSRVVLQDCMLPPYLEHDAVAYSSKEQRAEREDDVSAESFRIGLAKSPWPAAATTTTGLREASSQLWPRSSSMSDDVWCQVAYWELVTRIGRLYDVYANPFCICSDAPPEETGLCLNLLPNSCRTKLSERVRRHVGSGCQLTREADGIWLYNRSELTVFAASATLQLAQCHGTPAVKRVPGGSALLLFDFSRLAQLRLGIERLDNLHRGFSDAFCLRLSFSKGWGAEFSRRYITSCPCWFEIHLNDHVLPSS